MPAVGTTLAGKYRVEDVLGRGGMGVVLGARHTVLGHRVAIKLLTAAASANPTQLARFLREARATLELKSEHVVRVLDEGKTDDGQPFLVMEHLEGEDLHRVLGERGPLPIQEAVEYVLEACDAMVEAHARGIVHRDLKPSNLFLTKRGDGRPLIKVLDFGISKLAPREEDGEGELTETLTVLGSPGYMAPEQIRSARHADHRADVWGFGVVLFRLLTRKPAFEGEGAMGICAAILSDEPKPIRSFRPEVPVELAGVIARCLEKDPKDRYQSVTELARALCPFAPDSPTAARFRNVPRSSVTSSASSAMERTMDAPLVADAATNAAVTGNASSNVAPTRARWPYAVALVAVLGAAAFFALRRGEQPVAPAPASSTIPVAAVSPLAVIAGAQASAPPSSSASAPALPPAEPSAKTLAKPPIKKLPVAQPKASASVKKPWGTTIDDPL